MVNKIKDELGTLVEFKWRGLPFPVTHVEVDISHDLVVHKYPNLDSARVENTGRNPRIISAQAIFVNTISHDDNESWPIGKLYPNQYNKFIVNCNDTSIGDLQHPKFGIIPCRLQSAKPVINANFRGGEVVQCTWIETIRTPLFTDNTFIFDQVLSLLNQISRHAFSLDAKLSALKPSPQSLGIHHFGLTDLQNTVQKILSYPQQGNMFVLAKIAQARAIITLVGKIADECNQVISTAALITNPKTYEDEIKRLKSFADDIIRNAKNSFNTTSSSFNNPKPVVSSNDANSSNKKQLIQQYTAYKNNPKSLTLDQFKILKSQLISSSPSQISLVQLDSRTIAESIIKNRFAAIGVSPSFIPINPNTVDNKSNIQTLSQIIPDLQLLQAQLKLYIQNIGNQSATNNIVVYITTDYTTLTTLAIHLKNNIDDLTTLNPTLLDKPFIPPQTPVNYIQNV